LWTLLWTCVLAKKALHSLHADEPFRSPENFHPLINQLIQTNCMKRLIAVIALATTLTAGAQSLKWSVTTLADSWATDGLGGLAVIHYPAGPQLGAVTWIHSSGRVLLTNMIADLGENRSAYTVRLVRFNAAELAVQVQAGYEHAPGTNFVRRFKRDGTFKDTVLGAVETMDAIPSTLADARGFFTREPAEGGTGYIFRRYAN
jgi:hypothetical protein